MEKSKRNECFNGKYFVDKTQLSSLLKPGNG